MRIYRDLELVEHLGSGLERILNVYPKESFVIKQNYMKNVFYSSEGVESLYKLILKTPNKRSTFFAQELNTSVKNIERWIKKLKEENKISFHGSPKTGGYIAK